MAVRIHPSAVVEPGAALGENVVIGPLSHVASNVTIGDDSEIVASATVLGPTRIGRRNRIFPYATLGAAPQDKSFAGEPTELVLGDDNEIREQATLHRGTTKGGGFTRVGSRCLVMVGAHVAHDCELDDDVVLTNLTTLGGHVRIRSKAVLGGHVAIAPFVRIGRGAFVAGGACVEIDVPPFVIVAGDRARVRALNRVGLLRMGVPEASRELLERAFRMIWRSGEPLAAGRRAARAELGEDPFVRELLDFFEA